MRRTRIPDRTSNTSREPATRHRACIRSAPVNSACAASGNVGGWFRLFCLVVGNRVFLTHDWHGSRHPCQRRIR